MPATKPATPAPPPTPEVREDRALTPRISPALHSAIVAAADRFHTSINSICTCADGVGLKIPKTGTFGKVQPDPHMKNARVSSPERLSLCR